MAKPKPPREVYDVGYKKPPTATQFKKGQSGNPKGRPKGSTNFATMFKQVMEEKVVVREANGKARTITKFRAAITQVMNKAAAGNLQAFKLALGILNFVDAEAGASAPLLDDLDSQALLNEFLTDFGGPDVKPMPSSARSRSSRKRA